MKKILAFFNIFMLSGLFLFPGQSQAATLADRLQGRILLQVESNGEAWYVNPVNKKAYFLGRPADAFDIMKSLGLGVNNQNFDAFSRSGVPKRLAGRILIKVEDVGKAYYVNPVNMRLYYLGRPSDAFNVMRTLGLGISNNNFRQLEKAESSKPVPVQASMDRIRLERVAEGLSSPLVLTSARDGSGRLFVADQIGIIRVIDSNGELLAEPFLDLRSRMVSLNPTYDERGLLGLAFHPNFRNNGKFYVYYSAPLRESAPDNWDHTSRISEFMVSTTSASTVALDTERVILEVDQPQSNHNAGQIAFGPDGNLYIPLGDGGGANDVGIGHPAGGNAQDVNSLLGKILRIDVNATSSAYAIPSDNPFVGTDGRDEIFALGFRNPFHVSFDAGGTRALIAGDAGQNRWEEIDMVTRGGNYGWNIKEGRHCFDASNPDNEPNNCSSPGKTLIDPVIEYKNLRQGPSGVGAVVIGGYVYRGSAIPELRGKYIFGDWSRSYTQGDGVLFSADMTPGNWPFKEMKIDGMPNNRLGAYLLSFGVDDNNEIYVLARTTNTTIGTSGVIYKISAPTSSIADRQIIIDDFKYLPSDITVKAGTKIIWKNNDSVAHTVTSAGNFDSGNIPVGGSYERVMDKKGTYDYFCSLHPTMTAKIIVE